ncbi:hypothetical protein CB0940_02907 [Cercospora beticola]|uniref:Uncharacterized protein n=2 Tax=Cercospora beticola TaxID=122368 RepID=A0A2G5I5V8_CERBT|nr:hypothetical protein CB0940_02907 [Cercospora beticola]PIB00190.1 hypothetical protein CB0940_02907 [Cercospora beticola]
MASTSPLLRLPRELRDIIMLEAMTIRAPPPTRAFRTIPPPGTDGQFYLWSEHSNWQYLNLLAVNRQIRAEANDLTMQLYNAKRLRFEIDILVKGYVYTPKWTLQNLALQPGSTLDLQVNLKILSTEAFRANDGWPRQPGHIFRTLLNFLSRFLHLGPTFLNDDAPFSTPGPFFLRNLHLNVTFQDDYTRATHAETVREICRMMKALSKLDTASKYIGRIQVDASWQVQGEDFQLQREWNLDEKSKLTNGEGEELRESDWAALGFHFGDAWLQKYAHCNDRAG